MKGPAMDLSIVIPIKDEKDNIKKLHERITAAMQIADCRLQIAMQRPNSAIYNLQSEIVMLPTATAPASRGSNGGWRLRRVRR
jgi:hypothetical protein